MKGIILVLVSLISISVSAETVLFKGLEIDMQKGWEVKKEYGALVINSGSEGYVVELGTLKVHAEAIDIMVKDLTPDDGHSKIGEFILLKEKKKFNLYEGTWDRNWSVLSKDTYISIKNVSRKENYPVNEFVKKVVASLKWHTPNKQSKPTL